MRLLIEGCRQRLYVGTTILTPSPYSGMIPFIILNQSMISLTPNERKVDFNRLLGILYLGVLLGGRDGQDDHSAI